MCGIAGIYARGDGPISERRLLAMRDEQSHRGPDAVGLHTGPHIGLAFNRLAIVDLSPEANQPMATGDDGLWIVFNGEIYNFPDIRRELEALGRRFRTRGDTEVVLQGYAQWGLDVVPRLNGMFAFALWDARRQVLHLVRDRAGKKPLYFREADGEVAFASEVRALVRGLTGVPAVDPQALQAYLGYLCVPGQMSIYEGVRKVPPASIVTCTRAGLHVERYWRLSFQRKTSCDEREAIDRLDRLLEDATRMRLISDVPLGAFLSGGVDSSTVVAMMSRAGGRVRTFSVGFSDERLNELPHARAVARALETEHSEIVVEPDAAAILPRLVWHYGEPFADHSAVPTYYVASAARQHVTVALNGDGGDESFAGYSWNRDIRLAELYRHVVPGVLRRGLLKPIGAALERRVRREGAARALARLLSDWSDRSAADLFWIWPGFKRADLEAMCTPAFRSRLVHSDPGDYVHALFEGADALDDVDRGLEVVLESYLPDSLLVKSDIASMANSLEARSPLLDYRVLEFAASLPSGLKFPKLQSKRLLKTLAARLVPPSAVYRRKQGFSVPLAAWLRGPLRRPLEVLLRHPRFAKRGYFEQAAVAGYIDRHMIGEDHSQRLWALLCLELWFRMFVDGEISRQDSLHDLA